MTATQAPPVPFGRHLGMAGRAGRALLDEVLIEEATTYETWIVLNLLATGGPPNPRRDDFKRTLAAALPSLNDAAVTQLLGQLTLFELIRTDPTPANGGGAIEMTAEGEALYQRLLAAVTQRSAQALAGIDPDDLQTTIRVLGQFSETASRLALEWSQANSEPREAALLKTA